jgi:5-methylcytosine-specific restriction protein A
VPRRPCLEAGCPRLALPGKARCSEHHRVRDRQRGTATQRGYGYAWQQQSRQAIVAHRASHGDVCPGFGRDAHRVDPSDWCCDHDLGPLCRSCNAVKANTHDKQRAAVARPGGGWGRDATPITTTGPAASVAHVSNDE